METKKVVVCHYDPKWKEDFLQIQEELMQVLAPYASRIEHVGSTSVEGLAAKLVIDIDVVLLRADLLQSAIDALATIGYIYEGDLGVVGREAFCYTGKQHLRTHHLYVCPPNSPELKRHVAFREYLRSHPDAVARYSAVKLEAATLYPDDIDGYIRHKSPVIEDIYKHLNLS